MSSGEYKIQDYKMVIQVADTTNSAASKINTTDLTPESSWRLPAILNQLDHAKSLAEKIVSGTIEADDELENVIRSHIDLAHQITNGALSSVSHPDIKVPDDFVQFLSATSSVISTWPPTGLERLDVTATGSVSRGATASVVGKWDENEEIPKSTPRMAPSPNIDAPERGAGQQSSFGKSPPEES